MNDLMQKQNTMGLSTECLRIYLRDARVRRVKKFAPWQETVMSETVGERECAQ